MHLSCPLFFPSSSFLFLSFSQLLKKLIEHTEPTLQTAGTSTRVRKQQSKLKSHSTSTSNACLPRDQRCADFFFFSKSMLTSSLNQFKLRLFPMKKHTVMCPQTKSKHDTFVQKGVDVAVRCRRIFFFFLLHQETHATLDCNKDDGSCI